MLYFYCADHDPSLKAAPFAPGTFSTGREQIHKKMKDLFDNTKSVTWNMLASNILKSFWGKGDFPAFWSNEIDLILPTSQLPSVEDDPIGRIGCGLETPEVWETLRGCPWREQSVAD